MNKKRNKQTNKKQKTREKLKKKKRNKNKKEKGKTIVERIERRNESTMRTRACTNRVRMYVEHREDTRDRRTLDREEAEPVKLLRCSRIPRHRRNARS